jgi:hypothetical protein
MGVIHVIRIGPVLRPCNPEDGEALAKMKEAVPYRLEYKLERSRPHQRKFGALLSMIADYHEVYNTTAKALVAVKLAAGHCDYVLDPLGKGLVPIPKSISFKGMDQDRFEVFYNNAVQAVIDHLLPEMTIGRIDREVAERLQEAVYQF